MDTLKIVAIIVPSLLAAACFLWQMSTKARKSLRDAYIDVDRDALNMVTYALAPMSMKPQVDDCLVRFTNLEASWRKESFWLLKVKTSKYKNIYGKMKRVESLLQDCKLKDAYIQNNINNMSNAIVNNNVVNFTQILNQHSVEIGNLVQEWRKELYK